MASELRYTRDGFPFYQDDGSQPDAPFKSTWADLALKRAITKAAEEGYDAVSWTPGAKQAERYDLSKHISKLELTHNRDGVGELKYWTDRGEQSRPIKSEQELADFVGKDIAEKLYKQGKENNGKAKLSGVDLKVGGEGMTAFYDKMLVDKANALGKKFGAKVEWQTLPSEFTVTQVGKMTTGEPHFGEQFLLNAGDGVKQYVGIYEDGKFVANYMKKDVNKVIEQKSKEPFVVESTSIEGGDSGIRTFKTRKEAQDYVKSQEVRVPVFRLNDKLRDAAKRKGMPLFSAGLPFKFTPVDHDPFADKERRK